MTTPTRCRKATTKQDLLESVSIHYLAEGAANIVFRIQPYEPDTGYEPFIFEVETPNGPSYDLAAVLGNIIRVSKGLHKTLHAQQIMTDFSKEIKPLFTPKASQAPDDDESDADSLLLHLMDPWIISLDSSVLAALNQEIKLHSPRHKGHILKQPTALMMRDMSTIPGTCLTIEIKPKWLAQSRDAPPDARRCRTCALQAFRNQSEKGSDVYICPLELHAGTEDIIQGFVAHKVRDAGAKLEILVEVESRIVGAILEYLALGQGHALLEHLKQLQLRLDKEGVLAAENLHNLRLAMTLRDCSLFVKATYGEGEKIMVESTLGDLDFKMEGKVEDWKVKETELVEGGWYGDKGNVGWMFGGCFVGR